MMGFCHLNIHKCLNFSILGMVKILVNTGKLKLVIFLITGKCVKVGLHNQYD